MFKDVSNPNKMCSSPSEKKSKKQKTPKKSKKSRTFSDSFFGVSSLIGLSENELSMDSLSESNQSSGYSGREGFA